ncbi:hypothetical protein GGI07_005135 [Coemansia sp. Benny D115]|nr:hypothetical protein GGI07_005135 [Coemansia sp. Benny D115]
MLRRSLVGSRLSALGTALLGSRSVPAFSAAFQRNLLHSTALTRTADTFIVPQPQYGQPMVRPEEKKPNVMKVIEREALARADVDGRSKLFVRRAAPKSRLCAGDVVSVETQNNMSDPSSKSIFTGVCIAIYRRGIDTSFILRNVVQRVGVEMRFMAYSPLVKKIEILHKGSGYRRAKLFYLRESPGKAFQIKALKKMSQ